MCEKYDDEQLEDEVNKSTNAEKAEHDKQVRKRIDELLEKKRLKELLGDSDEWED